MKWYDEFARLDWGWNSYAGRPIDKSVIKLVRTITENPPQIVPCSSGGIQLEWHTNGDDIEIEIHPNGTVTGLASND